MLTIKNYKLFVKKLVIKPEPFIIIKIQGLTFSKLFKLKFCLGDNKNYLQNGTTVNSTLKKLKHVGALTEKLIKNGLLF